MQTASGNGAVAIGDPNTATGTGAVAIGANNTATGNGAVAVGNSNQAIGDGAIGIGQYANAIGTAATALGAGANAVGMNSTALGAGASTGGYANSTAIGAGARNTAANQVTIGVAGTTYYLPGITSSASLAAQSGTTYFTTTDSSGHLGTSVYGPNDIAALYNGLYSLNGAVSQLRNDVDKAYEGSAVAIALGGGLMPDNKKFAITANYGNYNGYSAFGAIGYVKLTDNIYINGGVGVGLTKGDVGGRVGATFAW
jgi:trimeric autotransporter adhesin